MEARDSSANRDAALTAAAPAQQHPPNEITGFPSLLNIQPMKSLDFLSFQTLLSKITASPYPSKQSINQITDIHPTKPLDYTPFQTLTQ